MTLVDTSHRIEKFVLFKYSSSLFFICLLFLYCAFHATCNLYSYQSDVFPGPHSFHCVHTSVYTHKTLCPLPSTATTSTFLLSSRFFLWQRHSRYFTLGRSKNFRPNSSVVFTFHQLLGTSPSFQCFMTFGLHSLSHVGFFPQSHHFRLFCCLKFLFNDEQFGFLFFNVQHTSLTVNHAKFEEILLHGP